MLFANSLCEWCNALSPWLTLKLHYTTYVASYIALDLISDKQVMFISIPMHVAKNIIIFYQWCNFY